MTAITEGTILWSPSPETVQQANITRYIQWLASERNVHLADYDELWQWSVTDLSGFWGSLWDYLEIVAQAKGDVVLADATMPRPAWFPDARLNYAENIVAKMPADGSVLFFKDENTPLQEITKAEIVSQIAALRAALLEMGVQKGDRVVAYLPNRPEAVIAVLAVASIGAVWSSCAPDFGVRSVLDRFSQIEPKVLITANGYQYNGRTYNRADVVDELVAKLPTVKHIIEVPVIDADPLPRATAWSNVMETYTNADLTFEQVPFAHPLWILYSSGTTGLPKPIVHGHGGNLLEHAKAGVFHNDLRAGDRFMWFTSTGWMMWNYMLGALLSGSSVVLYDGSPGYPSLDALWVLAEEAQVTYFGTSPAFVSACAKAELYPNQTHDLSRIRGVGSTGAPLTVSDFQWIYDNVGKDLALESLSGGTDLCTAFVGGARTKPVRAGEIQGASLGAKVEAYDAEGNPVIGEVGELVITAPMPSMPIYFWNDADHARYDASYFEMYPGVWRHGDWIKFNEHGGCVIYGRSDSTINRKGVRMGTSEIYECVLALDVVLDVLVVDLEMLGRDPFMPMFVVLREGVGLDDDLKAIIKRKLRKEVSPRHAPDDIFAVDEIPYTLSGKRLEIPVRRVLLGQDPEKIVNRGAIRNPAALQPFIEMAERLAPST